MLIGAYVTESDENAAGQTETSFICFRSDQRFNRLKL